MTSLNLNYLFLALSPKIVTLGWLGLQHIYLEELNSVHNSEEGPQGVLSVIFIGWGEEKSVF